MAPDVLMMYLEGTKNYSFSFVTCSNQNSIDFLNIQSDGNRRALIEPIVSLPLSVLAANLLPAVNGFPATLCIVARV